MTSPGSASTSAGVRLARVLVKGLLVVLVANVLGVACWVLVPSRPRAWESVNAPTIPPLPLAESLKRIEVWLADNHVPAARSLKPGLDAAEITATASIRAGIRATGGVHALPVARRPGRVL